MLQKFDPLVLQPRKPGLDNEWNINKRVVSNKNMYTGKKCQKLKRVYMFIRNSRVGTHTDYLRP